jgi:transposase
VHPNLITKWKPQALDSLSARFANGHARKDARFDAQLRALHAKLGELTVARDLLAKAFDR